MKPLRLRIGDRHLIIDANSPLAIELPQVDRSLQRGDSAQAIRELDRIWRAYPAEKSAIAAPFGHLLVREGEPAGLSMLVRAAESGPTEVVFADLLLALLNFGHAAAAGARLIEVLQRVALVPGGVLAAAIRQLFAALSPAAPGWAALTPDWCLHVEVPHLSGAVRIELHSDRGELLAVSEVEAVAGGGAACTFRLPRGLAQPIRCTANGQALFGGERAMPPDFRFDARSTATARRLGGWARFGWCLAEKPLIEIRAEDGSRQRLRANQAGPGSCWHFDLDLRAAGLRGGRFELRTRLPDGRFVALPDSPVILPAALAANLRRIAPSRPRAAVINSMRPVDVIIPVYRGREETLACIDAACATTAGDAASILVVDDATPEPALAADLDRLAAEGRITLLRNAENLGFSASVNRAMAVHPERDAVLLNADAVVFGDWLQRLRRTAYSEPRIGSVTPFSDDDSVVRYVDVRTGVDRRQRAAELDAYAAVAHRGQSAVLPVGVGFCMYLRRDCWRQTGAFDAASFGKGYGEESDWCMRALRRRWKHLLAADVFVHHAGGRSFGDRRAALLERCARLLELRHPGYDRRVARFLKADPLRCWRRSFERLALREQKRPVVLILTLGLPGGVQRFVNERCSLLEREGKLPLLLRPQEYTAEACVLQAAGKSSPSNLRFEVPDELDLLRQTLAELPIVAVEFHHFIGLDARIVETVLALDHPYDVYLHDYSWLCPQVTLVDESHQYCGEPALAACERCLKRNGSDLLESISVRALRKRSSHWIGSAQRVVAPAHDVAQRFGRYFPGVRIEVEPIERAVAIAPRRRGLQPRSPVRIALLGGIGAHKGYRVLRACIADAKRRSLDIEYVIIGYSENDALLLKTGKVFITGPYNDGEVAALLRRERPDVIWLPSVWPETWCYTLSHALAAGPPVVAFDIGAMAERLRAAGVGHLLPLVLTPPQINDELLRVACEGDAGESVFA